jgi:hypothetical protein
MPVGTILSISRDGRLLDILESTGQRRSAYSSTAKRLPGMHYCLLRPHDSVEYSILDGRNVADLIWTPGSEPELTDMPSVEISEIVAVTKNCVWAERIVPNCRDTIYVSNDYPGLRVGSFIRHTVERGDDGRFRASDVIEISREEAQAEIYAANDQA